MSISVTIDVRAENGDHVSVWHGHWPVSVPARGDTVEVRPNAQGQHRYFRIDSAHWVLHEPSHRRIGIEAPSSVILLATPIEASEVPA